MCFSLEASAITSGVLLTAGVISTVHAWKTPRRYFAMIPLFFGIQQGVEAFQWLVDKPSFCSTGLGYAFLFFAFLVWPFFTPFSYWMMERKPERKIWLKRFMLLGACGSLYLLSCLFLFPLSISLAHHRIVYEIAVPFFVVGMPLYVFSVCTGFFSSQPRGWFLAATTLGGFFVTVFAYLYAFTSVWCFFAAVLSLVVLAEVFAPQKERRVRRA